MPRGHFYSAQIGHSHFAALTKVTIQAYDRLTYCGTIYVFSRSFLPAALVFGQIGTRCPVPHQSLQPGPYRISFEATGFRRLIREKCRAKFHAMLRTGRADQRRALRYPFSGEVKAHQLPLHGRSKGHKGPIRGKARDISSGGLPFLGDRAVKPSSLMRCEIRFSELPATIPVLSQVRWIQKDPETRKYRIGLQFLL